MFDPVKWKRLGADTEGAAAVEYGLVAALVALAGLAAIVATGAEVATMWNDVADQATQAG
jgi:pilus assembly protein Flp/PilA